MKLSRVEVLRGELTCKSGLLICGASNGLSIGALSSEFIKNPITKEPYIPGSSLKGKLRCILEQEQGQYGQNGKGEKKKLKDKNDRTKFEMVPDSAPCGCGTCTICKLFGSHANGKNAIKSITRLIIRDAELSADSRKQIKESDVTEEICFETKVENVIDRQKGSTITGGMRTNERVAAGMKFDYELVLQTYDDDKDEDISKYKELVEKGLKLIEYTYLGGCGSRGYGNVEFSKKAPSDWECVYPGNPTKGQ